MSKLSIERAIEALYTVRAYYASLTAGYPKGKDCRGIGDVMCSEIANSCLMAIKALEQTRWIPVSERLPESNDEVLVTDDACGLALVGIDWFDSDSNRWWCSQNVTAWMPLPNPYRGGESDAK